MRQSITFLLFLLTINIFCQIPSCPKDGFGGNKNVVITAINPQIHFSDSVGEAPFSVYTSSFQTTAVGTNNSFEDVEYSWDFGDNSITGNYTFSHPVDLTNMKANSDQKGPEAAYLYETPGTYTITLTARAWNGNSYITSSISKTVTVGGWSGQDRYFDPAGGNDSNDGLTPSTPWKTWTQMMSWLNGGNNRKALLKSGETMLVSNSFITKKSKLRIDSYGSGSKPVLLINNITTGINILHINGTNSVISDHIYSNVIFDINNRTACGAFFGYSDNTSLLDRIMFLNCEFRNGNTETMLQTTGSGPKKSLLIWNCIFNANQSDRQSVYVYNTPYFAVVGGFFDGGNGNPILDHHIYVNECNHSLIRWVKFGIATSRSFCLNMNAPNIVNNDFRYTLIDACDITGTSNGIDFSNTYNDEALGRFTNTIVQNCAIHDLVYGTQGLGIFGYCVKDITIRNNRLYNIPLRDIDISDGNASISVYNNTFYTPQNMPHSSINTYIGQQGIILNNTFVNESQSGGYHMVGNFGITSNWNIDKNQYWNPNILNPYYDIINSTSLNFTNWQGLGHDLNGFVINPLFPNAVLGNFGQLPKANFNTIISNSQVSFTNLTTNNPAGWNITYNWNFGDGSPINNLNNPTYSYLNTGNYNVKLSSTNVCGTDTTSQNVSIIVTGVESLNNIDQVKIFPNPTIGLLNLIFGKEYEVVNATVFSLEGKQVLEFNDENTSQLIIQLNSLSPGRYIINLLLNKDLTSIKIQKK